mmetsp:Transcript_16189/g.35180  ORF Transcript_16189/g.35180 Transcript_16189/m.35180 type:complete len:228 (+) Transcript_16189:745-1428(+)
MTIRDINSGSGNEAGAGTLTDGARYASESTEMESAQALDVPVALPSINPEYDSSLDAAIPTARVVVREEKKTILLPDFSQKIITHRHMDDGTVDVFTQHHHTDGNTTYLERLNIPESEVALELDGPCSQGQRDAKGGPNAVTLAANETRQSVVSADSNLVVTQDGARSPEQEENNQTNCFVDHTCGHMCGYWCPFVGRVRPRAFPSFFRHCNQQRKSTILERRVPWW